jgi:energy-coupling factor transporter ATP-binding protein EcfA2
MRATIATLPAMAPEILVLDEPIAVLDPRWQRYIWVQADLAQTRRSRPMTRT